MVKRRSHLGPNEEARVRFLVELLRDLHGVCGVAVAACLARAPRRSRVRQEVRVQLPSDTLAALAEEQRYTSVLLGEPAASKTAPRGSTPRARAHVPMV